MASDGTIKISTELDSVQAQKAFSKFGNIDKKGLAVVATSVVAVKTALAGATLYAVKTGIEFESAFAGVKKTVDATDEELQMFRSEIRDMTKDIPQTAAAIAEVAEAAGQLGIKNAYLMDFTEVMSNMGVATNMSATEAATSLARLANITQMPQENFGRLGSTIVALGNNLATTESEITEMGLRLAGAGNQVGMSEAKILGLAGALSSVGIEADAGGSAVSTIMTKMQLAVEEGGESLKSFADVSGMSSEQFQKAFRDDAAQALVSFITGLGTMESRGKSSIATLAEMEITEIRQRDALLRLAGAGDILSKSLGIATQAWNENNALTNEAEQRYETLESRLQILKNNIADFGISVYDSLRDPLKNTVDESIVYVGRLHDAFQSGGLEGVVKEMGSLFDELTDDIAGTSEAAAGIITPIKDIVKVGGNLTKTVLPIMADGFEFTAKNLDVLIPLVTAAAAGYKAFNVIGKATAATTKANAVATELLSKMEKKNALQLVATNGGLTVRQILLAVYNGQISVTTGLTALWTTAQNALNKAISANPIGAAVVAIAAFIAVAKAVKSVVERQTEAEREHSQALKESKRAAEENLKQARERKQAYEELVQSQNEQAAGDIAQLNRLRALNDELNTIVDANGRVKEGEENRAAFITSQLSDALGIEISLTDNQISNYQELQSQIQSLIEQKRIEAVMSAQQAKYEEAVANQMKTAADASKNLTAMKEAENAVTAEKAELSKLEAEQDQAVIDGNKALVGVLGAKIKARKEDLANAEEDLKSAKEAYAENTELLAQYSSDIDRYTSLAEAAASGNADAIEAAINQITSGIKMASNATSEELQKQVIEVANMEAFIRQEVENGTPGFTQAMIDQAQGATTAALEEFAKAAPQSAKELAKVPPEAIAALIAGDMRGQLSAEAQGAVEEMLKQFEGLDEETQADFAQVWYGALKGLEGFESLADPAKEGADTFLESLRVALEVHSPSEAARRIFAQVWPGASEGLEEGTDSLNAKGKQVITSFLSSFSGLGEKAKGIGSQIMSFFGIGISSQQNNSKNAGRLNANAANEGAGSINPTSTGNIFGTRFASGVGGKANEALQKGKALATSADSGAKSKSGYDAGSSFGSGFIQGIGSWISSAASKAAEMAASALNAAKRALDSHSPSKKGRKLGKTLPQGVGLGIEDDTKLVEKASEEMSRTALDALNIEDLSEKMKSIDIPEVMDRVYMAVEERQGAVADKIIHEHVVRERTAGLSDAGENLQQMKNEELQALGRIFAEKAAPMLVKAISESGIKMEMYGETVGTLISPTVDGQLSAASIKAGRYMK